MKLQISGTPGESIALTLVDDKAPITTALPLRTVTRFELTCDGARLELFVPELEIEVEIPDVDGKTMQALDTLRRHIQDLEHEIANLRRYQ